jgi:hypothetical protein
MSHNTTTAFTEKAKQGQPHISFGSDAFHQHVRPDKEQENSRTTPAQEQEPRHSEAVHESARADLKRKHTKSFSLDNNAPSFKPAQDDRFGVNL